MVETVSAPHRGNGEAAGRFLLTASVVVAEDFVERCLILRACLGSTGWHAPGILVAVNSNTPHPAHHSEPRIAPSKKRPACKKPSVRRQVCELEDARAM